MPSEQKSQFEIRSSGDGQKEFWDDFVFGLKVLLRVLFVLAQIGGIVLYSQNASIRAITMALLSSLATLPFYVLKRPPSLLSVSSGKLATAWFALLMMLSFLALFGVRPEVRAGGSFLIYFLSTPTILLPVFLSRGAMIAALVPAPAPMAVALMALCFYLQWLRFVPWLFSMPAVPTSKAPARRRI